MAQAGIEPDSETYKVLLCGFAKNGMSEELSATLSNYSLLIKTIRYDNLFT